MFNNFLLWILFFFFNFNFNFFFKCGNKNSLSPEEGSNVSPEEGGRELNSLYIIYSKGRGNNEDEGPSRKDFKTAEEFELAYYNWHKKFSKGLRSTLFKKEYEEELSEGFSNVPLADRGTILKMGLKMMGLELKDLRKVIKEYILKGYMGNKKWSKKKGSKKKV